MNRRIPPLGKDKQAHLNTVQLMKRHVAVLLLLLLLVLRLVLRLVLQLVLPCFIVVADVLQRACRPCWPRPRSRCLSSPQGPVPATAERCHASHHGQADPVEGHHRWRLRDAWRPAQGLLHIPPGQGRSRAWTCFALVLTCVFLNIQVAEGGCGSAWRADKRCFRQPFWVAIRVVRWGRPHHRLGAPRLRRRPWPTVPSLRRAALPPTVKIHARVRRGRQPRHGRRWGGGEEAAGKGKGKRVHPR